MTPWEREERWRHWRNWLIVTACAVTVMSFVQTPWDRFIEDAYAIEQLDLTTPITGQSVTAYKVLSLYMGTSPPVIDWTVGDNLGGTFSGSYNRTEAATLLSILNTANLTTNSLQKRVITKLQTDGYLPSGTITGTPQ